MIIDPSTYLMRKPNEAIPLFSGKITVRASTGIYDSEGSIELRWGPHAHIAVEIPESRNFFGFDSAVSISIDGATVSAGINVTKINMGSNEPIRVRGMLNGSLGVGPTSGFSSLTLRVVGMRPYLNLSSGKLPGKSKLNTVELVSTDWAIAIEPVEAIREVAEELNTNGGYAITHLVTASRADQSAFTDVDAEDLRMALYYFFSFAEGRWIAPILPTAQIAGGTETWSDWGSWRIEPWRSVLTWADTQHGASLNDAFVGFMTLWRDAEWAETVKLAIYWHTESNLNSSGQEAGIILTQMAIDAIAWQYFVQINKKLTPSAFKKLSSGERIRTLCTTLLIPLTLPHRLPETVLRSQQMNWCDIADLVTGVRNAIVHPDKTNRAVVFGGSDNFIHDAWVCGTWLLEVLLLRLMNYKGSYQDRRKHEHFRGDVDVMP